MAEVDGDESAPQRESWHLDKKVPIAMMTAILLQTGGMIWWASGLEEKVRAHTTALFDQAQRIVKLEDARLAAAERLSKIETLATSIADSVSRIERKVDADRERAPQRPFHPEQ